MGDYTDLCARLDLGVFDAPHTVSDEDRDADMKKAAAAIRELEAREEAMRQAGVTMSRAADKHFASAKEQEARAEAAEAKRNESEGILARMTLELEAAEAKLAEVEKERDEAREEAADHRRVWNEDNDKIDALTAQVEAMRGALEPLKLIADAYDANELDDEARKHWGRNNEHTTKTAPSEIELYQGRGGKRLLTLQDAFNARAALTTENQTNG